MNRQSQYLFEAPPQTQCSPYQPGEVAKSKTQQGFLPSKVIQHARGLLIADFSVDWPTPKNSVKQEPLLKQWLKDIVQVVRANPSTKIRIIGFSDCVGKEKNNSLLRRDRARRVNQLLYQLLGSSSQWKDVRSRITFDAAPTGDYVADNSTAEGRAQNRGVLIEHKRVVTFDKDSPIIGQLPDNCNRIRTVTVWLNAFIPRDVSGLTRKVPDPGVKLDPTMTGKTMFETNFGCGLTDQRSFSADIKASSRMHSEAKIDLDKPRIIDQKHRIHPSIQVDCLNGRVLCNETSSTEPMIFSFIGISSANEVMIHVKGSQGPACPDSSLLKKAGQLLVDAKIDYEGTFFIKRVARNYVDISFLGTVDLFPAYEFVAILNDSNPIHLGGKLPPPGSSPITHLGTKQKIHFGRRLWLKCSNGKQVAGLYQRIIN